MQGFCKVCLFYFSKFLFLAIDLKSKTSVLDLKKTI